MFELGMLGFGIFFAVLIWLIARDPYSESGVDGPPRTVLFDLDHIPSSESVGQTDEEDRRDAERAKLEADLPRCKVEIMGRVYEIVDYEKLKELEEKEDQ